MGSNHTYQIYTLFDLIVKYNTEGIINPISTLHVKECVHVSHMWWYVVI
jgi:hypothetical protein